MKKEIIIIECDFCGRNMIKKNDPIYYLIETDSPGWGTIRGQGEGKTVICKKCFEKIIKPNIKN